MAMVEDLTAFFDTDEFAVEATLDGATVQGIFDNSTFVSDPGTGMASVHPTFTLPTADVPSNPAGKSLVKDGVTYRVVTHDKDGTGVSVLTLEYTS